MVLRHRYTSREQVEKVWICQKHFLKWLQQPAEEDT